MSALPTGAELRPPTAAFERSSRPSTTASSLSNPLHAAPRLPALVVALDHAIQSVAATAGLSRRERAVLRLVAMGYHHPEIGEELGITARTVKMHAASLRAKTGTQSRSALMRLLFSA